MDLPNIEDIDITDEDWRKTPASVKRFVVALVQRVEYLERRVEELEEKLNTNSSNSSKPPSSDPPWAKKRKRKKGKGRKRGGQPGHEGKTRELVPADEVDKTIKCQPSGCEHCGCKDIETTEGDYVRHQQFELPEIKPIVIEYRQYRYWCPDCERWHTAMLPLEAGQGILGPGFMALVGLLAGKYHMSTRGIEEFLDDAFGLKVSLGTVSRTEERVSEALAEPVEEAQEYIKEQPVVGMDETGWKVAGQRAWMWVATTPLVCIFALRFSRGAEVAKELLGEFFKGIVVSDRWSAYNWVETARRQLCWSHLLRDFEKISERTGMAGAIGTRLVRHGERLFVLINKVRDGTLSIEAFRRRHVAIRDKMRSLLGFGASCGHTKTERTCKNIIKLFDAMWTFVNNSGVEPTNNASERAVRPGVLWRKNCYGTQSERGNLFVERIMTVSMTCRLQGRNVLDFLTEAIEAHNACRPKPSLLPIMEEEVQLALAA